MLVADWADALGPALVAAIEAKGFVDLTPVQKAVLDPALADRDLRVSSQTGSGKTVAIGFVLRALAAEPGQRGEPARPKGLVIAPTRELAKQVAEELTWLYAPLGTRIATATGGASIRDERRALAMGPTVVVGTPGRLIDHLTRGAIDPSGLSAIVLDEADRMLDLGFRDELETILGMAPEGHRTHLLSATFPREVLALANRFQTQPARVEGTPLGAANTDIDHVIHLVDGHDRLSAVVNLLLAYPDEQMLLFARTRADVGELAFELSALGFAVSALSGEMEQRERDRALDAFRRAHHRALVATDVAARGIDVPDIARVIHVDPPTDPDSYTHRSGRTGRAGRKGTSSILVSPGMFRKAAALLDRARVNYRFQALPTAEEITASADLRVFESLVADPAPDTTEAFDSRIQGLAKRLIEHPELERTVSRLLLKSRANGPTEPRSLRRIEPPTRGKPVLGAARPRGPVMPGGRGAAGPGARFEGSRSYTPFQVSWGHAHGADARRLLAMLCRRGGIAGTDVGAIRIGERSSIIEVASDVAPGFAEAVQVPDPRNPRVLVRPERTSGGNSGHEGHERPRATHEGHERPRPAPEAAEHPRAVHEAPEHPRAVHHEAVERPRAAHEAVERPRAVHEAPERSRPVVFDASAHRPRAATPFVRGAGFPADLPQRDLPPRVHPRSPASQLAAHLAPAPTRGAAPRHAAKPRPALPPKFGVVKRKASRG